MTQTGSLGNNILMKVNFIGRKSIVDDFVDLVNRPEKKVKILFLHGEGGIGKTRLLLHLLGIAGNASPSALVAKEIVDLYHIHTHTQEGFMRLLAESLPAGEHELAEYRKKLAALETARLSGDLHHIPGLLEEAKSALVSDLVAISRQRRLVLAFDTAERWVYSPKSGVFKAEAWTLLMRLASAVKNAIILIAGRDMVANINVAHVLIEDAKQNGVKVQEIPVEPFTPEETRGYINAVLKNRGEIGLIQEEMDAILTLTGGRPISLALFLENYLLTSRDRSMKNFVDKANSYKIADEEGKKQILRSFELEIINRIMNDQHVAEVLRAIGRAPKGIDSEMLGRLLTIDARQARFRLAPIQNLVFMKEYGFNKEYKLAAEEPRFFLHDRMYDLLRETIYSVRNDPPLAHRAYEQIKKYYLDKIEQTMQTLNGLYSPEGKNVGPQAVNLREIAEWESRRQQLYCELVYYSIRQPSPSEGLKDFCRYTHEGVLTNTPEALTLLGQELFSYLADVDPNPSVVPDPHFRFFAENLVHLLDIQRAFALSDHKKVIDLTEDLKGKIVAQSDGFEPECKLLHCAMDVWQGYSNIFINRLDEAETALNAVLETLQAFETAYDWLQWYADYLIGLASRAMGYYLRVRGQHEQAANYYGTALENWKRINFKVEQAYTQNDLGFAQAEQGKFFDALENINMGLKLRRELGLGRQIGLSLNTKAHLQIRQGDYENALTLATSAYTLFNALSYQRGLGLSMIAIAEAYRRLAGSEDEETAVSERVRYLLYARDYSGRAAELFSKKKLDEASREVEARIELGCALRDRLKYTEAMGSWEIKDFEQQSEHALRTAAQMAGRQRIAYRQVDALVNLSWLRYFVDHRTVADFDEINKAVGEAEEALQAMLQDKPDKFPVTTGVVEGNILWAQYGKLNSLKGNAALDQCLCPGGGGIAARHGTQPGLR